MVASSEGRITQTFDLYTRPDSPSDGVTVKANPEPATPIEPAPTQEVAEKVLADHLPASAESGDASLSYGPDIRKSALRAVVLARRKQAAREYSGRIMTNYNNAAAVFAEIHRRRQSAH